MNDIIGGKLKRGKNKCMCTSKRFLDNYLMILFNGEGCV